MKTKIVGWCYVVASAVFLVAFIFLTVIPFITNIGGTVSSDFFEQLIIGSTSLLVGFFSFIFGSALKEYKIWSWYVGIIIFPLITLGNLYTLISSFNFILVVILCVNLFFIYAIISEKGLFRVDNN
jgi:hypothetical protein